MTGRPPPAARFGGSLQRVRFITAACGRGECGTCPPVRKGHLPCSHECHDAAAAAALAYRCSPCQGGDHPGCWAKVGKLWAEVPGRAALVTVPCTCERCAA